MIRYFAIGLLLSFAIGSLLAQPKTLDRKYEPIVISAGELSGFGGSDFDGAPVSQLYAFAYDESSLSWRMIPFQVDERDTSGSYYTADEVAGLDANDELSFMASDAGDFPGGWINNADSEQYRRYQIEITDPLAPGKKGWVYLYRSSSLTPQFEPYVQYIPAPSDTTPADTVVGVTYKMGAGGDEIGESSGFFDYLSFPQVSNDDLLDRQKIRVSVSILTINEEFFVFNTINKVAGPVRIIKELVLDIPLVNEMIALPFQFFAFSVELGGTFSISADQGVSQISQRLDLSPNAVGMQFFSNKNSTPVLVDGSPDSVTTEIDLLPDINWLQFTGDQGTMVTILKISAIGDEQKLSYLDDTTEDPKDTGDKMRYGETGMQVNSSESIEGDFPLGLKSFFLEPNQSSSVGEQLAQFEQNPLTVQGELQDFSAVSVESSEETTPEAFVLGQNFPNPFNPETIINYRLPKSGLKAVTTSLKIYDLLGREVRTLVDEKQSPGFYKVLWDGRDTFGRKVSSGIYLYQLKSGNSLLTKKMLLVR